MNNPITMLRAFASNKSFMRKRSSYVAISILVISAQSILALAQEDSSSANYPAKPVRILIGFAPGGGTDVVGRIAAQKFTESFGKSFVVENRPGASGNIAANLVAKATPDGYSLLVTADVHTVNASLFSNLPFDPIKDFAAVGTLASGPQTIAVHPSMPRTLRELIALAKAKPGGISYASADPGTISFVAMELFSSMAGIKLLNVPYKSSGSSIIAVIGGEVPVLSIALGLALESAKSGKLRMLAVTSAERVPLAPDVPTVAEAGGLPGYESASWLGLLAPARTPSSIVNKLNAEIERMMQSRDVREQLAVRAWVPLIHSPTALANKLKSDVVRWGKVIRAAGVKVD